MFLRFRTVSFLVTVPARGLGLEFAGLGLRVKGSWFGSLGVGV